MRTLLHALVQGGLIAAKLTGLTAASWWIILLPTWAPLAVIALMQLVILSMIALAAARKGK